MSAHMKGRHTSPNKCIGVFVAIPGLKQKAYNIPDNESIRKKLSVFLEKLDAEKSEDNSWEEATPWEDLAKERLAKYKKAGIVLRGARYREGISQVKLSEKTGISQDNISKIENGKRTVGEKVAKKLAKVLNFDYRLLIEF